MKVHEVCKQGFGLHQTFPPRFGWFKKAYDQALTNNAIFSDPDATVELGVGKNMVDAIAFWSLAFRILKAEQISKKTSAVYSSTEFGSLLFGEDGLDPYLELPQSLWFLHWMAMRPGGRLPVWWLTFGAFGQYEFSSEELVEFVIGETGSGPWQYTNTKPIIKDVDCLLRMYSPRMSKNKTALDDYLDSPFRDLGLVSPSSIDKGSYRFNVGAKPGLDDLLVLLTCLDFIRLQDTNSLTIPRLVADLGSPGRMFKLSEPALTSAINEVVNEIDGVVLATPAGVPQLIIEDDILEVMKSILHKMYPGWMGESDLAQVFQLSVPQSDGVKAKRTKTKKSDVLSASVRPEAVNVAENPKKKTPRVKTDRAQKLTSSKKSSSTAKTSTKKKPTTAKTGAKRK
jgi:hypothetical protein